MSATCRDAFVVHPGASDPPRLDHKGDTGKTIGRTVSFQPLTR